MKIAVIIPYFQRAPGLLRRAVQSVLDQDGLAGACVEILIADDASPNPPEPEIAGLSRAGFEIRILKRPNGGPARARNTALDAAGQPDFIAFLDSDDWWDPGHLSAARAALAGEAAFYFAENYYEPGLTWFETLDQARQMADAASHRSGDTCLISNEALLPIFLTSCMAHTSTVVIDARKVEVPRFDTAQTHGGEDYIFWLGVIARSDYSAFGLTPHVHRGRGVDLCRSAYDWSSPFCARRIYFDLVFRKKVLRQFCRNDAQRAAMRQMAWVLRRDLFSVLARNSFVHFEACLPVWGRLLKNDPVFFLSIPGFAAGIFRRRIGAARTAPG